MDFAVFGSCSHPDQEVRYGYAILNPLNSVANQWYPGTGSNWKSRNAIKEVVRIVQTEEYQYQDPITRFLKELYVEFDFDSGRKWLEIAVAVVENDFFLSGFKSEFVDNARYLISETYCRIHQKIDIECVSPYLHHDPDS